jgi:hypothetical protein
MGRLIVSQTRLGYLNAASWRDPDRIHKNHHRDVAASGRRRGVNEGHRERTRDSGRLARDSCAERSVGEPSGTLLRFRFFNAWQYLARKPELCQKLCQTS